MAVSPARLVIRSVQYKDGGLFRCRVDFKANQTQNTFVSLVVIGETEKIYLRLGKLSIQ